MSLQAESQWGGAEDSDIRRTLVRPKSAKCRNRPPSIPPQGSPQTSTLGSAPVAHNQSPDIQRTLVRPKSAKCRNRPPSILPQGSPQTSTLGSAPVAHNQSPDIQRTLVRPKSAKGRNRPPSIPPQGSPQTSTLGSAPQAHNQSPEPSRTSTESREDKSQQSTRAMNSQKTKSAGRDMRKGSGHTKGLCRSQTKVTRLCSSQSSTDMMFTLPTKAPCTLNRYSILPSIGCLGEHPSGLSSEDRGA